MADQFLGGGIGVGTLEGGLDLGGGIAQFLQRGPGQGHIASLLYRSRECGAGEIQFYGCAADLILQLQDDPLGDLFANALGGGKELFVSGHDGQGEILRSGSQDGHGGLGTYAINGGQQLIAPLFLLGNKAVEVKGVLPDGLGDIEPGILVQLELACGIGRDPAAVAHAAAVDDGKAGFQNGHGTGNIIDHTKPPDLCCAWASREVLDRPWHRAIAMASAASSGLGMADRCKSRMVMSCIWCLVALP